MHLLPARTEVPTLTRRPAAFARRYRFPLLILVAGATVDAVTTFRNVAVLGAGIEVHPVQRLVFEVLGPAAGVPVAKVLQVCFVLLVAAWWEPWCGWVLALWGVLYTLAAANNHFLWL